MTNYQKCSETAKLVRRALKEAFPTIKFSVRSDTYAGGASIDVNWTDGPATEDVEAVAKRFQGGYFDGMTDYKGGRVHSMNGQEVHFGADFIFCHRAISDAYRTRCAAVWEAMTGQQRCDLWNRTPGKMMGWTIEENGPDLLARVAGTKPRPSPTAEGVELIRSY